jgi:hypothetical protein
MAKMPSQREYEEREIREARHHLDEVKKASLADRKEAQAAFLAAMQHHPRRVGERVSWLLDGNYGYGSMILAKQILHSPRMNRVAALTQMIGAFEWQSPEEMTRQAWKRLSAGEKHELARAVEHAIEQAENNED